MGLLLLRWFLSALALLAVAYLYPGVRVDGFFAAAVAALTLFLAIRVTADRAAEAAQDAVLAAATLALSEGLLAEDDQLDMDLPATVLSMRMASAGKANLLRHDTATEQHAERQRKGRKFFCRFHRQSLRKQG